jgi:putative ABC transport system substrate-binding protein
VPPDNTTVQYRDLVISLAARHRLPAVYAFRSFAAAGGLMSYGIDLFEQYRQAASYIDRILRGANPADLPVQAPTKFELVSFASVGRHRTNVRFRDNFGNNSSVLT